MYPETRDVGSSDTSKSSSQGGAQRVQRSDSSLEYLESLAARLGVPTLGQHDAAAAGLQMVVAQLEPPGSFSSCSLERLSKRRQLDPEEFSLVSCGDAEAVYDHMVELKASMLRRSGNLKTCL